MNKNSSDQVNNKKKGKNQINDFSPQTKVSVDPYMGNGRIRFISPFYYGDYRTYSQ